MGGCRASIHHHGGSRGQGVDFPRRSDADFDSSIICRKAALASTKSGIEASSQQPSESAFLSN